jgi:hypothetical protein
MPIKGIVKCTSCDKEFCGTFPDGKSDSDYYEFEVDDEFFTSVIGKDEFGLDLVQALIDHHEDTKWTGRVRGHTEFEVFLEDGTTGELTTRSHGISYKHKGKEREGY